MNSNLTAFEINTRVWIKRFGESAKLSDVPLKYFRDLYAEGINVIWLMGVWKTCESVIDDCCLGVDLVNSYNKSLGNWKRDDVIGSPFSIDEYDVNPNLGTWEDLSKLKSELNKIGLKLMLDFVPNHYSRDSIHVKNRPEIFLKTDEDIMQRDTYTFFRSKFDNEIYSHGRDPFFLAWSDTIQINYFNAIARDFQVNNLLKIAKVCDGVRCDMAMLVLNNIFFNTWTGVLSKYKLDKPKDEFWRVAIKKVKSKFPNFIFLGEVYWDLEWDLQQMGFDFTYDKKLTDRLLNNDMQEVKGHLYADKDYQTKSMRFIENHDEERAVTNFGKERSLAAAVSMSTVQGMKLYYDGQFEGKRIKLPVQLGREPIEKPSARINKFYQKLLRIIKQEIFEKGLWNMLEPLPAGPGNDSYSNVLAWEWRLDNERRIVIVNYSDVTSQSRLKFSTDSSKNEITLNDLLNEQKYVRKVEEIVKLGLFVELKAYNCHIFSLD